MTDKVYDFLTAPGRTAAEIRKKRRIRMEKMSAAIPGAIRCDVPRVRSTPSDRMSAMVIEADELDHEIDWLMDRLREERRHITAMAELLDDQEKRVIILRYLDRITWAGIALKLHRSKSTVHRIHRAAVEKLEKML